MGSALEKLTEMRAVAKKAKEEMSALAKDVMREAFAEVFAKHPKLDSVTWQQYTPYFNDGDECTFSVNEISKVSWDGQELEDLYSSTYKRYPGLKQAIDGANAAQQIPDEDELREWFGDHMEVTVKRDGTVDTEEYRHD